MGVSDDVKTKPWLFVFFCIKRYIGKGKDYFK